MRHWLSLILVVAVAASACHRDPAEDIDAGPPNAAERAKLRAEMIAQAQPFDGHKEYLLDDPSIVEPCLDKALKFITNGNTPPPSQRGSVIFHARACMSDMSEIDGGVELVEKKIEDHYDHPTITREGSKVTIDVGYVSGNLRNAPKWGWVIDSTPRIVDHEWATGEVLRFFKMAIAKFPDAPLYRIDVEVPQIAGSRLKWTYVYNRHTIRIWDPSRYRGRGIATADVPGGNLDAITTLHTSKLKIDNETSSPP